MRFNWLMGLGLLLLSQVSLASVKLKQCVWVDKSTTFLYPGCINENFERLNKHTGLKFDRCTNIGDDFNPLFRRCISKNMKHVSDRLKVELRQCAGSIPGAEYAYVQCNIDNFKRIERHLSSRR